MEAPPGRRKVTALDGLVGRLVQRGQLVRTGVRHGPQVDPPGDAVLDGELQELVQVGLHLLDGGRTGEERHRLALRRAATSGEACFYLGTDTAADDMDTVRAALPRAGTLVVVGGRGWLQADETALIAQVRKDAGSAAEQIGLGAAGAGTVVALQAIGGAAGNMICVHNVVAASATVGLVNREGEIIRMNRPTVRPDQAPRAPALPPATLARARTPR